MAVVVVGVRIHVVAALVRRAMTAGIVSAVTGGVVITGIVGTKGMARMGSRTHRGAIDMVPPWHCR